MAHQDAIGLIETQGLVGIIEAADVMCKAANVEIAGKECIGGGYVTVMVKGDIAAVKAAVDAGAEAVTRIGGKLILAHTIARPHSGVSSLILVNGYRELMKQLYEPRNYYRRIRTFLEHNRPEGPRLRLAWSDFQAFVKSLWLLGVWHRGRRAYWRFCVTTLLRRPRQLHQAIALTIIGHHFRRVAKSL